MIKWFEIIINTDDTSKFKFDHFAFIFICIWESYFVLCFFCDVFEDERPSSGFTIYATQSLVIYIA